MNEPRQGWIKIPFNNGVVILCQPQDYPEVLVNTFPALNFKQAQINVDTKTLVYSSTDGEEEAPIIAYKEDIEAARKAAIDWLHEILKSNLPTPPPNQDN